MYIREKDGMIAVYRNLELMMDTFDSEYRLIMNSDFLIERSLDNPNFGRVK